MNLTLYNVHDDELLMLIEHRQERLADTNDPPTEQEIEKIDAAIRRCEIPTPARVSRVAGVLRYWRSQRDTAEAEINRLRAILTHTDCMIERLKEHCAIVLEQLPMPSRGCRKVVGADGSQLMLKGNGGLQPLVIQDESLLPDECCRMEGWIRADFWKAIWARMDASPAPNDNNLVQLHRVPDNAAIRAKIAEPCPTCAPPHDGDRTVEDLRDCPTCGGSGKQAVAGARLGERGLHLEIK